MYSDIVGTLLASLGGATIIVAAFAHILGKIWTDRIAKATSAKLNSQLEILKSNNTLALEEFKTKSSLILKEKEGFSNISQEFYQSFFRERVDTYLKLLDLKNEYITTMEEEFVTELREGWWEIYHSTYTSLRKLMIEKQLYISNDLEKLFDKFRSEASVYIKEADMVEAIYDDDDDNSQKVYEHLKSVYEKFARETGEHMNAVMAQIGKDVSLLRSRIEMDKA